MNLLSYTKLDEVEVAVHLGELSAWSVEDEMLTRSFEFGSYAEGVMFACAVGHLAEQLNHHPDIYIGYQKVRIATTTHDSDGLTSYDFELASRIDAIA